MNVRFTSLLAAAALAFPASAFAQQGGSLGARGSLLLGFEDAAGPAMPSIRLDGEIPQKSLSPMVGLSIVGSLGYSRQSDSNEFFGTKYEYATNILKLVPAARFTFGRNAKIRPYADAGVGVYYASTTLTTTFTTDTGYPYYTPYTVKESVDDSEVGLMFRFAGGINLEVSNGFWLGGEIGINPYLGDAINDSTLVLMVGATMRL